MRRELQEERCDERQETEITEGTVLIDQKSQGCQRDRFLSRLTNSRNLQNKDHGDGSN